jgi:hypothetical protein
MDRRRKCQNQTDDVRRKTAFIFIEIIVGSSSRFSLRGFLLKEAGHSVENVKLGFTGSRLGENWCDGGATEAKMAGHIFTSDRSS